MRAALIVFVIFNVALLAAHRIRNAGAPPASMSTRVESESIAIIPLRHALTTVARCVELGPLSTQEAALARQMLDARALGEITTSAEAPVTDGWWVYIPPRGNRTEVLQRAKEVEKMGVRDFHVFEDGPNKLAISLGVFRSEEAASEYVRDLERRGLRNARMGRQQQRASARMIYIRSQAPEVIALVTEVKAQFTRAEIRQVACPDAARALPRTR